MPCCRCVWPDADRLVIDEDARPAHRRPTSPKTGKIVKRASRKTAVAAAAALGSDKLDGLQLSVGTWCASVLLPFATAQYCCIYYMYVPVHYVYMHVHNAFLVPISAL